MGVRTHVRRALSRRCRAEGVVLLCFAVVFILLQAGSLTRRSATWDEPIHLTAGYFALTDGDHRIDASHPPFLRMWAALPLLAMNPSDADTAVIDRSTPDTWFSDAYQFAHRFLYRLNDADRLLFASRSMIVALGIVLGALVFFWVYEWLGLGPATIVLAFYAMEPNLLAHSSLVTTDLGVSCFIFGAVYFLWRTCQRVSVANVSGLAAFVALACVSKYSAILLGPIVLLLLVLAVQRGQLTSRAAGALAALLVVTTYAAIWAVYGFRYTPSTSAEWLFRIDGSPMAANVPQLARIVSWIDAHQLLPNAFSHGAVMSQGSTLEWPAFLLGQLNTGGWWYYFPVAFGLKTPIALIFLFGAGLLVCVSGASRIGSFTLVFVGVPLAVYLGAAMSSGINMGVRHILPVYPFVLLIGAAAVRELVAAPARAYRVALALLMVFAAVELARAYPRPLTFFNTFAGGPANGYRYLADSNLAWGGNLKALKNWMDRSGVAHVNLAYFGTADPAYYGIDCTYLPGSPSFATDLVAKPRLPGYVAISPTILSGVYLLPQWRMFYSPFRTREPVAVIGNTMRVYWVDSWPEDVLPPASPDVHLSLADSLLFGMKWNDRAVDHYRAFLAHHPNHPPALTRLGVALAESGQLDEAVDVFSRVAALTPGDANAVTNLNEARRRRALRR